MRRPITANHRPRLRAVLFTLFCCWLALATGTAYAIDLEAIAELARKRAGQPYQPGEPLPDQVRNLSYSAWQGIRFDPAKALWRGPDNYFQVTMLPAGSFYQQRVKLNIIDSSGVHPVPFDKGLFQFADPNVERDTPADLGYTGFSLTRPAGRGEPPEPFLTFAGGSYFQAIGRNQVMGTFGRGIAIDTGLSSGEEFPAFVEFWLERPSAKSTSMKFFGLLEGNSLTGAYEFTVKPGDATHIAVRARLYLRGQPQLVGIAPLTGMFLYGENTHRPSGHWRPRVHDANGLLVHDGVSGEWLWRPLLNPTHLLTSQLQTSSLRGFGLMQRNQRFEDFQDPEARFERHPSVWVAPRGEWGKGHLSLILLPAPNETNRNVVAFFVADRPLQSGAELAFDYDIFFGDERISRQPVARAINTFVGDGHRLDPANETGSYLFAVNFAGGRLAELPKDAPVVGRITPLEGGQVLRQYVQRIPAIDGWRLTMVVRPEAGKALALRAFLALEEEALSETWTYHLPAQNDLLQGAP